MLSKLQQFHSRILDWYAENQRQLPWRATKDPYHIWVSEIMLQQTQVGTVIPYYQRFLNRFPTIASLAEADLEEVLKLWEGLGYYSRARNLHQAAIFLNESNAITLPADLAEMKKLPGIGDYTAAAILSIAFQKPYPAVDGNIKRVYARLFQIETPINTPASAKVFKKSATENFNSQHPGEYNQALMDLGAMICKPTQPHCHQCPINTFCDAYESGTVDQYPKKVARKKTPVYQIAVAVVLKGEYFLITRRKEQGLLGGLWEFPGGKLEENEKAEDACCREVKEETGLNVSLITHLASVQHAYTHFKIEMEVFVCRYESGKVKLAGPIDYRWISVNQIADFPFPKANHKFIPKLKNWLQFN